MVSPYQKIMRLLLPNRRIQSYTGFICCWDYQQQYGQAYENDPLHLSITIHQYTPTALPFSNSPEKIDQSLLAKVSRDDPPLHCQIRFGLAAPAWLFFPRIGICQFSRSYLNGGELSQIQQQRMIPPKTSFRTLPRMEDEAFLFFEDEEQVKEKQAQLKQEENTFICLQQIRDAAQHLSDPLSSSTPSNNSASPKKSLNHNFQKHAVVTIKKLMRIKYNYNGSASQKLAHLMWNIFMSSGVKNKKILVVLFGKADPKDEGFVKLIKNSGFQEILEYEEGMIRQAQEILRERFIESVTDQVVRDNLSKCRNIRQNQEFLVYFMELAKMIRNGPLVRLRINDRTAKKIEAIIKAEKQEE